jgi:hypothetical protein
MTPATVVGFSVDWTSFTRVVPIVRSVVSVANTGLMRWDRVMPRR